MKNFKAFKIPFIGLKEGIHKFNYQIENKFFDAFEYDEFQNANFNVDILFNKKETMLQLDFTAKGIVNVPCDLTGEYFDMNIEGDFSLIVKFGVEFNNEDDELLILSHGAYEIEVQQYIYELLVLSVPQKRIKPGLEIMEDDASETSKRNKEQNKEVNKSDIDPRWDQLKQLLGK